MLSKAVIFDLDGTLWDSREEVTKAWQEQEILETGKTHIDLELTSSLMGLPMKEIAMAIAPNEYSEEEKIAFGERAFLAENNYLSTHPGKLFPKVEETLMELKSRGHRLFIVSNCQNGYIENFVYHYGKGLFEGFLCYGDTHREKSFTIRKLMSSYGIEEASYVGDTLGDEIEAKKAECFFVYAEYGFGKSDKPDAIIVHFEDLLSL